jgi:hypothetical protein
VYAGALVATTSPFIVHIAFEPSNDSMGQFKSTESPNRALKNSGIGRPVIVGFPIKANNLLQNLGFIKGECNLLVDKMCVSSKVLVKFAKNQLFN